MRERENRRPEGGIPWEHRITLAARKETALPTTAMSAITTTAMAKATTAATMTREGDGYYYLLDTEARGSNAPDLCFLPSCLLPKTLLKGISTQSPNLQPKKIFDCLEGIFDLLGQNSLPEGQNFNCLVICSIAITIIEIACSLLIAIVINRNCWPTSCNRHLLLPCILQPDLLENPSRRINAINCTRYPCVDANGAVVTTVGCVGWKCGATVERIFKQG